MRVWAALVAGFLLVGCASSNAADRQQLQVVGSFYPLAWAAERVGGRDAAVIDLTPPGVEAHDTNLTAREVAEVEGADVLLLLGYLGFQPQVEAAARHAGGEVVQVVRGMKLRPSQEQGLSADPHVWLDPVLMERIVRTVSAALIRADPGDRVALVNRTRSTMKALTELDRSYRAGLTVCRYRTFVTTHEAFGYVADRYGLHQIGIEGLTPEAEPSASQLRSAETAIRSGRAAPAVFYERTAEGQRIGKSVAGAVGVRALPLDTLEFDPAPGTYLTVMRSNLAALERGLRCG